MKRYWISWYSGGYEEEGCVDEPPFQYWWSGQRDRPNYGLSDEKYAEYLKIEDEDEGDALRNALKTAIIALDDWTNTYAPEFCDEERVKQAQNRLTEYGTLYYIATVVKQCRDALKE